MLKSRLTTALIISLTLGLAPFTPMPHVMEKIAWLFNGTPFKLIDWFDLVMHGSPWIWLGWEVFVKIWGKRV